MNQDFLDLLQAFADAEGRFLLVGAYALGLYGKPRATGDLDVWVDATPENARRVMQALKAFGAPMADIAKDRQGASRTWRTSRDWNSPHS